MEKGVGNESVLQTLVQAHPLLETIDLPEQGGPPPERGGYTPSEERSRYVEGEELGRGGAGVVLRAFDRDLRRVVALKRLRHDRQVFAELSLLVKEAQLTAQLEHPNIPAIHSLGIDEEERLYFTMPLIEGETLAQWLQREFPLPVPRVLRLFLQVAYPVALAHHKGVIHRDIKPRNIILGRFGEVRLIDWGLARVLKGSEEAPASQSRRREEGALPGGGRPEGRDEEQRAFARSTKARSSKETSLGEAETEQLPRPEELAKRGVEISVSSPETQDGYIKGTLGYMAPEQAEGRHDLDERVDIYALGALLYCMLSGRPPVQRDSAELAVVDTVLGRIPPLSEQVSLSPGLVALVHKALAREREERYATVEEMIDDVVAFLEGDPVSAYQENLFQRFGRWYMGPVKTDDGPFRVMHLDLICGFSTFAGMALGIWTAKWLSGWPSWLIALAALVMLFACFPFMRRKKTPHRSASPEDSYNSTSPTR